MTLAVPASAPPRARSWNEVVGWTLLGLAATVVVASGLDTWAATGRAMIFLGTLAAAGGGFVLALVHRADGTRGEHERLGWLLAVAAAVGVVASLVVVALQVAEASGRGLAGVVDGPSLELVLGGNAWAAAVLRLLGLVQVVHGSARWWTPAGRFHLCVGGLVALSSFLLTGHTAVSEPRLTVLTSNLLHTGTAALWFGGLVILAVVLRDGDRYGRTAGSAARLVARFSAVAGVAVVALMVAGTALAVIELGRPRDLVATGYGQLLLAKVAIVAGVLVLAAWNHVRLVPAVEAGGQAADRAWLGLRRSLGRELAGLVVVLMVTAVLVQQSPGVGS